ncbi:MAG: hypothetical protein M3198_17395 [Actinomycetota bacterium]|nr:hypothetical protein [Actinomycetota bacterium]
MVHNVVGPPSAGKTAAVDAWLERSSPDGVLRSWLPYESAATFRPLADVIEQAAGARPGARADEIKGKLEALPGMGADVVRRLAHVSGDRSLVFPNHEIFWATRLFLQLVSSRHPLVVVWEGLERAQPTFLDMLEYLAGRDAAVLVVTTGRPEVLRARPHWKTDEETAPVDATVLADGDPPGDELHRVEDLGGFDRGVVDGAAVIGEAFTLQALAAVRGDRPGETLASSIDRLVAAGIFRRRPGATDEKLTFSSGWLRETVYDRLADGIAAEAHERVASYLESSETAVFDELIAFHLEFAVEHAKPGARRSLLNRAVNRLAAAGRRALGRSDAPAAADLLERGAVLIDVADTRRPRLLLSLCDALLDLGDMQRIRRIAEAGLQEAREVDDDLAAARFGVWRRIALARLAPDPAPEDVDEELRIASMMERAGEHLGAAESYQLFAERLWEELDYAGAEEALEKALRNARAANHLRLESKIAAWLLFSFFWGPRPASSGIERSGSFSGEFTNDRLLEANRLTTLGGLHGLAGDFDKGRALLLRARDIQTDLGQPLVISWNPQIGATIALVEGDLEGAEAEARLAFDEAQHMADPGHAATGASLLAKALYASGRFEEAFQYTRLAERASFGAPEAAQGEWRATRAKLDARRGNVERAVATIRGTLDLYDARAMPRDRADALVDLAEVLEMADHRDDQRSALLEAADLYEKKGVTPAVLEVRRRVVRLA